MVDRTVDFHGVLLLGGAIYLVIIGGLSRWTVWGLSLVIGLITWRIVPA